MSGLIQSALMSLGQDELINRGQEFAGEHFQPTDDPYYEMTSDGKKHRRRLPDYCTKEESRSWKSLQNKAWLHDKSLCGCCCWTENIGWGPFLAIFPVIGPTLMYWVHNKLIKMADKKFNLSMEVKIKMRSNIAIDLCISLVPFLGVVFAWLNACSTRNAAMVYNCVSQRALDRYTREQHVTQARGDKVGNQLHNSNLAQQQGYKKSTEQKQFSVPSNQSNAPTRIVPQVPYPNNTYNGHNTHGGYINAQQQQPQMQNYNQQYQQEPPVQTQQFKNQYIPMNNMRPPPNSYNPNMG